MQPQIAAITIGTMILHTYHLLSQYRVMIYDVDCSCMIALYVDSSLTIATH